MQHNTKNELECIRLVYGAANCSGTTVWKRCRCLIPIRRIPTHTIFYCLYYRLSETERSDQWPKMPYIRKSMVPTHERSILKFREQCGWIYWKNRTVRRQKWPIVKHWPYYSLCNWFTNQNFSYIEELHLYRLQRALSLTALDYQQRLNWAHIFRQQTIAVPSFVGMWCDNICDPMFLYNS